MKDIKITAKKYKTAPQFPMTYITFDLFIKKLG